MNTDLRREKLPGDIERWHLNGRYVESAPRNDYADVAMSCSHCGSAFAASVNPETMRRAEAFCKAHLSGEDCQKV